MAAIVQCSKSPKKMENPPTADPSAALGKEMEEGVTVQVGATYSCRSQDGTYRDAEVVKMRMNKWAGKEEFYVRYIGLTGQQNEWVDKPRLVLSQPVKEEDVANGKNEDLAETGKTDQEVEDGGPEKKKAKVEALGDNSVVASGDLICLLCKGHFTDPVAVECGHNFCRSCIDDARNDQDSFTCPKCQKVVTEKSCTTNRAMDIPAKKVRASAVLAPVKPVQFDVTQPLGNCPEHDERLKLYCKNCGTLSCIICRDSLKHANHSFLPIQDAVGLYRTQLPFMVAPLRKALKWNKQLNGAQKQTVQKHKAIMEECEQQVEAEFQKLQDFLQEQKEKAMQRLQENGGNFLKEMETNVSNMQENEKKLTQAIAIANEKMTATDVTSFLTGMTPFIDECEEQQALSFGYTRLDKNVNLHIKPGSIQYSVWKEMKALVAPDVQICEAKEDRPAKHPVKGVPKKDVNVGEQGCPPVGAPQKDVVVPDPGKQKIQSLPAKPGIKLVLLIGNSVITAARRQATQGQLGINLGFKEEHYKVLWNGVPNMRWCDLIPELEKMNFSTSPPAVIVIHVGDTDLIQKNDLTSCKEVIKNDLSKICSLYPNTRVIWSCMLPRRAWRKTEIDQARKACIDEVSNSAKLGGYFTVRHIQVEEALMHRWNSRKKVVRDPEFMGPELDNFCFYIKDAVISVMPSSSFGSSEPL